MSLARYTSLAMIARETQQEGSGMAALAAGFDLSCVTDSFRDDPYPTYAALRQYDPVRRMPDGSLYLTRHADLVSVYRDAHAFSSDKRTAFAPVFGDGPLFDHHTTSLVFSDPPLHTRVRRLMVGALTARAVTAMEPGLVALVDTLLDRARDLGTIDAIDDFAAAIPVEVIGNLLDVPLADRAPLRGWSLDILGALEPALTNQGRARGDASVAAFTGYLRELVAERRLRPGDPGTDVLTRLIGTDADGERLSEHELLQNCIFILNAGHETTTNLIGNALHLLATHPKQRERLIADPTLIRTAIEEALRFESSNQIGNRLATEAAIIGGEPVAAGTPITLCIGAANRDPAVFDNAETFDIAREPNRHLAFGLGPHQCVGLTLARLEGRTAIGRFVARFPAYELADAPVRGGRVRFRGFSKLPLRVA